MSDVSVEVEATVEKFKNIGEEVEIYRTPINHEGVVYRYASYKKNNQVVGQIIVTTDGKVLPLARIKKVPWIAVGVNSTAMYISGELRQWAQAPTAVLKKQLRVSK